MQGPRREVHRGPNPELGAGGGGGKARFGGRGPGSTLDAHGRSVPKQEMQRGEEEGPRTGHVLAQGACPSLAGAQAHRGTAGKLSPAAPPARRAPDTC